jgi:hypothetical protein
MNLLLIDISDGAFTGLAYKSSLFGHKVRVFNGPGHTNPNLLKGFPDIQVIDNWVAAVKWADLVLISDIMKFLPKLDVLKKAGVPYFGPSVSSSKLEVDRALGMRVLESRGIECPPYVSFNSLKEAEEYQWKNDNRYVFKPLGDVEDKALTYCAKSPEDMISTLQRWQKQGMQNNQPVMLQEFIPGIEFAVAKAMGSEGFIGPALESFEHKPLMNDDIGPGTGEQGTVQKYVYQSKLFNEALRPMESDLVLENKEPFRSTSFKASCLTKHYAQWKQIWLNWATKAMWTLTVLSTRRVKCGPSSLLLVGDGHSSIFS